MDSKRFPGKALAEICGRPMIWWVYDQCLQCPDLADVVVATDSKDIWRVCAKLGMEYEMTGAHDNGTSRVAEVVKGNSRIKSDDVVINVQGDEPLIDPGAISELCRLFKEGRGSVQVGSLVRCVDEREAGSADLVKCAWNENESRAVYFSRNMVPWGAAEYWGHVGIYGYTKEILGLYRYLTPGTLEKCEHLEQLRWLEGGVAIHVAETQYESVGVDVPGDIERVEEVLGLFGGRGWEP
jgi:3-deoxy-manno-octulosonate cytidylyltransferase (CMP-KDO synthetase)